MSTIDRRGLNLGLILAAIGIYFLLGRQFQFEGPGPLLLLIGTVLFALTALRGFRGPIIPAGVLLGLGTGFLLRDPLAPWMPPWATLVLGIGAGLLLASAIDRFAGRSGGTRRPGTFVPGIILVVIALAAGLSRSVAVPESFYKTVWSLWPWALVAAGILLVVQAARSRKSSKAP
jgi:hypothetical protein